MSKNKKVFFTRVGVPWSLIILGLLPLSPDVRWQVCRLALLVICTGYQLRGLMEAWVSQPVEVNAVPEDDTSE